MQNVHICRLSTAGSDRATGYNMSSKLIRRGGRLFVGWLDAPAEKGQLARIMLGVCDGSTGVLQKTVQLGEGIDNHCGPALALDGSGRLHAIVGAHSGVFLYRWSDAPEDDASWRDPEPLGPGDTYPSLAVDREGILHLAHRERGDRWQLWYRRKRPDRPWEAPVPLAISPVPGYNHFMQSLTVGPTGSVHIVFQFHYAESGRAQDCRGRAAVHLQSDDSGDTWYNEGERCGALPLTIDTMRPIVHRPDGDARQHGLRVGNHVVDAGNHPWFFSSMPGACGGILWRRTDAGWDGIDLASVIPNLNMEGGRSAAISRDAENRIHLMVAANPDGRETSWFDPSLELFYVILNADGGLVSCRQVTGSDASAAHWLPALEQWDWARPQGCCADGFWFAYTRGLNAGGIGGDNKSALQTEVYLGKV